jgi:SAM-dependent methyltransferase
VRIANQEQADHWNGEEASHWVTHQAAYDRMLAPFTAMLLDAAALRPGDRVLDVGCGCGATTCAAARAAAPGRVLGVDLSEPMLARGQASAAAAGCSPPGEQAPETITIGAPSSGQALDPGEALLEYGLLGWVGGQFEGAAIGGAGLAGMA